MSKAINKASDRAQPNKNMGWRPIHLTNTPKMKEKTEPTTP